MMQDNLSSSVMVDTCSMVSSKPKMLPNVILAVNT